MTSTNSFAGSSELTLKAKSGSSRQLSRESYSLERRGMDEEVFFSGGVFSDTIDDGRAGADIELTHDAVTAVTSTGQHFALRFSDINLDIGGYNNRVVFCRNADRSLTIFCDEKKFPASLAYAAGGLLDDQIAEKKLKLKSSNRSSRNLILGIVVASVLLLVGLFFGVRYAGSAAVTAVPVSVDKQIGKHAYQGMDVGGPEVKDEVVVSAMQKIVDRLAPHAAIEGMDFEIHVVDSSQVNAFALPGGVMVVFTGLIEHADEPEQVAGVLAHEMAHATMRHGLERISQSLGMAAAINLLLGNVEGLVVLGSELFQMATINSYSRGQETEADSEGVRMLHAAKIDPLGLAQFFEILKEEGNDVPDGLEWISTHPDHDARIMNIRGLVGELSPQDYEPLDLDWEDIKKRVGKDANE